MSTTANFSEWTREEKDEFAQKRMNEMKLFNEKLKQRHNEVEQDRITAEQRNSSVTSSVKTVLKREKAPDIKEDIVKKSSYEREWDIGKSDIEHWNSPKYGSYHKSSRRGNMDRKCDIREDWRASGNSYTDHRKQGYNSDGKKNAPGNSGFKQYDSNYQGKFGYKYENANSPRRSRGRGFRSSAVTYRQSQKTSSDEHKRKEYSKTSTPKWKQSGVWSTSSSNSGPEAQTLDNIHVIKSSEKCTSSLWDVEEISEDQHKQNRVESWVKSVNSAGTWEGSEKGNRDYRSYNKDHEKNFVKNRMYEGSSKQNWDSSTSNIHCKVTPSSREVHLAEKSNKNDGQKIIYPSHRATYQSRGNRSGGSGTYEHPETLNNRRRIDNRRKNIGDQSKRSYGFKAGMQHDADEKSSGRHFPDRSDVQESDSKDYGKEKFSKFREQAKYVSDAWIEANLDQCDYNKFGKGRFPKTKGQNAHASNDNKWDNEESDKYDFNYYKKDKSSWPKFQKRVEHNEPWYDKNEQSNSEEYGFPGKQKEFRRPFKKGMAVKSNLNIKTTRNQSQENTNVSDTWGNDADQNLVKPAHHEQETEAHGAWSDVEQEIVKPSYCGKQTESHSAWSDVEQEIVEPSHHKKKRNEYVGGWSDDHEETLKSDTHNKVEQSGWSVEQVVKPDGNAKYNTSVGWDDVKEVKRSSCGKGGNTHWGWGKVEEEKLSNLDNAEGTWNDIEQEPVKSVDSIESEKLNFGDCKENLTKPTLQSNEVSSDTKLMPSYTNDLSKPCMEGTYFQSSVTNDTNYEILNLHDNNIGNIKSPEHSSLQNTELAKVPDSVNDDISDVQEKSNGNGELNEPNTKDVDKSLQVAQEEECGSTIYGVFEKGARISEDKKVADEILNDSTHFFAEENVELLNKKDFKDKNQEILPPDSQLSNASSKQTRGSDLNENSGETFDEICKKSISIENSSLVDNGADNEALLQASKLDHLIKETISGIPLLETDEVYPDNAVAKLEDKISSCDEIDNSKHTLINTTDKCSQVEEAANCQLSSDLIVSTTLGLVCENSPVLYSQGHWAKCTRENDQNSIDATEETSVRSAEALTKNSENDCALLLSGDLPIKNVKEKTELPDQTVKVQDEVFECAEKSVDTKCDHISNSVITPKFQFCSKEAAHSASCETTNDDFSAYSCQLPEFQPAFSEETKLNALAKPKEQICEDSDLCDENSKTVAYDEIEKATKCQHTLTNVNDRVNDLSTKNTESYSASSVLQASKSDENFCEKSQSVSSQPVLMSSSEFSENKKILFPGSLAATEQTSILTTKVLLQDSGNSCALSLSDDGGWSTVSEDNDSSPDGNDDPNNC